MKKRMFVLFATMLFCVGVCAMPVAAEDASWVSVAGIEGGQIAFDASTGTITDAESSITQAEIPASIQGVAVEHIGEEAFMYCDALTIVVVPDTVLTIESYAFAACSSLVQVQVSDSVTVIGDHAFAYCTSLSEIDLSAALVTIGDSAFKACGQLLAITLPTSLESIGTYAFENTGLCEIEIPASVTSIAEGAFFDCDNLVNVVIPDTVTMVGDWAFAYSASLQTAIVSQSVLEMGSEVFYNCVSLIAVEVADDVTAIGRQAFAFCDSLTDIYFGGNETQWGEIAADTPANVMVHYETTMPQTVAADTQLQADVASTATSTGGMTIGELLFAVVAISTLLIIGYYIYVWEARKEAKAAQLSGDGTPENDSPEE